MIIGLAGEHPNDSNAIGSLLKRYYDSRHNVKVLVKNLTGDNLKTNKGRRIIKSEYDAEKPDILVYIRDLDALSTDRDKLKERNLEFEKLQTEISGICILLLNIFELEALILADIESFNTHYGSSIAKVNDPMKVGTPKEHLKEQTNHLARPYHESHNEEVFSILNPTVVKVNCKYFSDFLAKMKLSGVA